MRLVKWMMKSFLTKLNQVAPMVLSVTRKIKLSASCLMTDAGGYHHYADAIVEEGTCDEGIMKQC